MNDTQKERMLTVLAKAFDRASVRATHERQAALLIVAELQGGGFTIVPMARRRDA